MKRWPVWVILLVLSACSDVDVDSGAVTRPPQSIAPLFSADTYSQGINSDNLVGTWMAVGNLREDVHHPYSLNHSVNHQRLFSIELASDGERYYFYEINAPLVDAYSEQALLLREPVGFSVFDSYFTTAGFMVFIHNNDSMTLRANMNRFDGELELVKISDSSHRRVVNTNLAKVGTVSISFQRINNHGELIEAGTIETALINVAHTQHRIEWLSEELESYVDQYQKLDFFIAADAFIEALYGKDYLLALNNSTPANLSLGIQSLGLLNYQLKNSLASEESRIDYAGVYNTVADKVLIDHRGGEVSFSFMYHDPWPDLSISTSARNADEADEDFAAYTFLKVKVDYQY